ncbi:MAG: hypothetical protein QOH62_3362 [Solirubrobacteraceae bacterium]|nr:hypothetical protein [Solirubrobacteraceae bacterium]
MVTVALFACACSTAAASAAAPLVRATVDPTAKSVKVARHFLGISAEYNGLFRVLGHPQAGVNPVAVQLLANLATEGQGEPGLRIGGGTADSTWWNPALRPRPNGVEIDMVPDSREAIYNFQRATGAPLILDLNLAAGKVAYARDWAQAALARLGPGAIEALEIGNEPDVYASGRPFGTLPRTRPKGYGLPDYSRELRRFTKSLSGLPGHPKLAGPSTCCGLWDARTARLVRAQKGRLGLLSFHVYATNACSNATPKDRLTVANLLSDATLRRAGARLAVIRAQAAKAHRRVRITETNSASCSGRTGITDTYAASLWMTDWLFLMAAQGFEGVNVHINGNYAPFSFGYADNHFVGIAAPSYYGMLLFARATADGARLLPSTTLTATARGRAPIHVWATADRVGHARIVVVNKDRKQAGDAVITVHDGRGAATLERLTAPALDAKTGVALGGLSVGDPSTDGRLTGTSVTETVTPSGTTYRFPMPAAGAAILTVPIPADPFS